MVNRKQYAHLLLANLTYLRLSQELPHIGDLQPDKQWAVLTLQMEAYGPKAQPRLFYQKLKILHLEFPLQKPNLPPLLLPLQNFQSLSLDNLALLVFRVHPKAPAILIYHHSS